MRACLGSERGKMKTKTKKQLLVVVITFVTALFVMAATFYIYASFYYRADEIAIAEMQNNTSIEVKDNLTILPSSIPSDTGLIFYPGAKVEHIAYLPILSKLAQSGITCVLVKMPLNMAIFNQDAANQVFDQLPDIKNWYVGGHSMGGAMASSYASKNPDKIKGLILLGAYLYGSYPPEKTLTIYGTLNSSLEKNIDYTDNIVIIEGGNHAQFGNYGEQKGDPPATISSEEQQRIAMEAILNFAIR